MLPVGSRKEAGHLTLANAFDTEQIFGRCPQNLCRGVKMFNKPPVAAKPQARNKAESLCFQTEKLIKENNDKLSASDKAPLESAVTKCRELAKGDDADAIISAHDELEQATHALSKVLYEAAAQRGSEAPQPGGEAATPADDAIDAEFEVKKDE